MRKLQRYRAKDPATLGPAAEKFHGVFALSAGRTPKEMHHSGVHILLNLGITVADEMIVSLYDLPLTFRFAAPQKFTEDQYEVLVGSFLGRKNDNEKYGPSLLLTPEFAAAQARTEMLHPEEIAAHRKLAREFSAQIERKIGLPYRTMSAEQVGNLVVAEFDLSAQVAEIRARYLSDRNQRVDGMSALALEDRSWQLRQQHMPLPGSCWFGPKKRYFG